MPGDAGRIKGANDLQGRPTGRTDQPRAVTTLRCTGASAFWIASSVATCRGFATSNGSSLATINNAPFGNRSASMPGGGDILAASAGASYVNHPP
jgi:hypothetical protein